MIGDAVVFEIRKVILLSVAGFLSHFFLSFFSVRREERKRKESNGI